MSGTNLVFGAVRGGREIVPPVTLSAAAGTIGLVVIGGGLARGHSLFMKRLVREMNAPGTRSLACPMPQP